MWRRRPAGTFPPSIWARRWKKNVRIGRAAWSEVPSPNWRVEDFKESSKCRITYSCAIEYKRQNSASLVSGGSCCVLCVSFFLSDWLSSSWRGWKVNRTQRGQDPNTAVPLQYQSQVLVNGLCQKSGLPWTTCRGPMCSSSPAALQLDSILLRHTWFTERAERNKRYN